MRDGTGNIERIPARDGGQYTCCAGLCSILQGLTIVTVNTKLHTRLLLTHLELVEEGEEAGKGGKMSKRVWSLIGLLFSIWIIVVAVVLMFHFKGTIAAEPAYGGQYVSNADLKQVFNDLSNISLALLGAGILAGIILGQSIKNLLQE